MALTIQDIRSHQIWLNKKASIRTHKVTRQFDKEHVHASAALTSVNQYDSHQSLAGFTQAVSASGVENFAVKTLYTGGRYNGVAGYEVTAFARESVTSLTFELMGNGGAAAQFMFFVHSLGAKGSGRASFGADWRAQSFRTVLGFDADRKELLEVHEIFGDDKFIAAEAEVQREAKRTGLRLTVADADFRYDPDARYSLSTRGILKTELKKKPK